MPVHHAPATDLRTDFTLLIDGAPAIASSSLDVIVADIDEHSRLVREQQFGPIVPVLKFSDEGDAIRRANDTRYGLSGSVWSSSPQRAAELASRLEVGTAWVNHHRATSATVPFGGAKESGIGRVYSEMGLKAYLEPRVVSVLTSA
jgi:acyl-CoA reductase-like NAD-dependent aldehyde dehydrogenase